MTGKKMGRPTDNPKPHKIALRIDDATLAILERYCERNRIERSEGVRRAIQLLDDKK